jgi:hypothetical protein
MAVRFEVLAAVNVDHCLFGCDVVYSVRSSPKFLRTILKMETVVPEKRCNILLDYYRASYFRRTGLVSKTLGKNFLTEYAYRSCKENVGEGRNEVLCNGWKKRMDMAEFRNMQVKAAQEKCMKEHCSSYVEVGIWKAYSSRIQ